MAIVGIVVALVVGVVIGVVAGRRTSSPGAASDLDDTLPIESTQRTADPTVNLLRDAFDRLDLAVVVADRAGRTILRNRAASAMAGTHVGVLVDEQIDRALAAALDGRAGERRIDLHGPPRVSLELGSAVLADGSAIVVVNDVSQRVRTDAMRTDFVANISHELKTPVGAIAVLAEALGEEDDPQVVARLSGRILDESSRAVVTIDDLLELSRIEFARPTEELVDVNAVVQSAIDRGRSLEGSDGIGLTSFGRPGEIVVRADARQLNTAIGNLVENAVKYSDAGGVVQVRTRVDDRHVEVMVSDQGVGIPERDLDRIFERFYRVDRARSRRTGGSGLGLAIVRHVASNHGGEVVVSSQEGEGSTFVLRLPASIVVRSGPAAPDDVSADDVTGDEASDDGTVIDGPDRATADPGIGGVSGVERRAADRARRVVGSRPAGPGTTTRGGGEDD